MNVRFMFAAAALAALPVAGIAQENTARALAATCANCHGTDGRAVTKDVPALAGLPKDNIVGAMKAFQAGRRPATVMHQLAKGYTDQQIDLIAGYFAAQRR
jgi:cytochrome c553